jgi:hypothetical protein
MSRKKKKPSWGAFPLMGAIPTGTVIQKGDPTAGESLKDFRKRYDAETEAARQAPIRQAEAEMTKSLSELQQVTKGFYSGQLDDIEANINSERAKDILFTPPLLKGRFLGEDIQAAFIEFIEKGLPKTGYGLSADGMRRVALYCIGQRNHADVSNANAIGLAFERLLALSVFQPGEVDPAKAPRPVDAPAPKVNLDELLETVSADSTEGRKKLIEAVTDAAITGEFRACWQAFVTSIYENFGHVFTEQEKKLIYDTMIRRNRNFNRPADYDEIRVALVQSKNLPPHLVYPAERLSLDLENADLNDHSVRQEFARRTRELAEHS